jgi:long-chain fatty acid transport protein
MRKLLTLLLAIMLIATLSPAVFATNGTQLIGIGPVSRSMGGVGIAAPQDAISAVFANPAAMCFGPYCPSSQFDFAGTIFMPEQKAEVTANGQTTKSSSHEQNYAIPAIGFSVPIGEADTRWRFGLSAYGVSGLGVDYRDKAIDRQDAYFPGTPNESPLASGTYTNLQLMKFAPTIAYQVLPNLSVGTSFQINYSTLDLGEGASAAYSYGVQLGVLYKPLDQLSLGLTYISPQEAKYENVARLDAFTPDKYQDLKLEQPQQVGLGVAYEFLKPRVLLETNVKWINWSDAKGFEDFDWNDQWVFAVGGQWEAIDHVFFRVGYNYAENPVDKHDGWNGSFNNPTGPEFVNVQGSNIPRYYYEAFRVIGFPALVEHHITAGIGYEVGESLILNLSYMHAFENSLSESGSSPDSAAGSTSGAKIKSKLYEDSLSCAFTWRF